MSDLEVRTDNSTVIANLIAENDRLKAALTLIAEVQGVHNNGDKLTGYMVVCGFMQNVAKEALNVKSA
jgi:hypothetical protein